MPEKTATMTRAEMLKLPAEERVRVIGHRRYVGGTSPQLWFGHGRRQFHYLVSQGLEPSHRFLDVACGSLRLGQFLIPYLERGHYLGLEGEPALVKAGLKHELLYNLAELKQPKFAFNYDFDATSLGMFDYALAQSLFTHLTEEDIAKCFSQLAKSASPTAKFYVTYYEGEPFAHQQGRDGSDAQLGWRYTIQKLEQLATPSGWHLTRIGDWGHPRNQKMLVAERQAR